MAGEGKFPLRSAWFMDQRTRSGLLYNAFTVDGETAQKSVWNDYFFEAASGITANLVLTEDNDSLTADGTVAGSGINASLVVTEAADALSATATHPVAASLTSTEANDSLSANGSSGAAHGNPCRLSMGLSMGL
jgi:hypothetical protein